MICHANQHLIFELYKSAFQWRSHDWPVEGGERYIYAPPIFFLVKILRGKDVFDVFNMTFLFFFRFVLILTFHCQRILVKYLLSCIHSVSWHPTFYDWIVIVYLKQYHVYTWPIIHCFNQYNRKTFFKIKLENFIFTWIVNISI